MLRIARHARTLLAASLVSILALGATAALRGEPVGVLYESSGSFQGNPVTGCVQFADNGNFSAIFGNEKETVVNFGSDWTEVNLFIISFWSTPNGDKDGAAGASGIRLLFGAFVFGTVDFDGVNLLPFSGIVGQCVPGGMPL